MSFHDKRFPNETPEYRAARDRLLQAEIDLREAVEEVARRRRAMPMGGAVPEDYEFEGTSPEGGTRTVRLSELFAEGRNSLIVYSFMYGPRMEQPCPMCTSVIDGLNAMAPHVNDRTSMVVVAKSPIGRIMEFARTRGWSSIRLLSAEHCSYDRDYWSSDEQGNQYPMLNVFSRQDGQVRHFWGTEMLYAKLEGQPRHVDLIWPIWNLFDLTPEGRGTDWYPKLSYDQ